MTLRRRGCHGNDRYALETDGATVHQFDLLAPGPCAEFLLAQKCADQVRALT